jgi:crotonobetainyl-CoA:carnitine CoA-transferase CaiB-like acyl-CoA transferase
MHAPVPRLSGTPAALRRPAPRIGQHEAEILGSLADAEEQARLTLMSAARRSS